MLYAVLFKFETKNILWWDKWYTYVVFAGLFLMVVMGAWAGAVAPRKGRSSYRWFLIGFLVPVIGLILVYALKPLPGAPVKVTEEEAEEELEEEPPPAPVKKAEAKKPAPEPEKEEVKAAPALVEEEEIEKPEPERITLNVKGTPEEFEKNAASFFQEHKWTESSRGEDRVTYERKTGDETELTAFKYKAAGEDSTQVTWSYVHGYITDETLLTIRDFLKFLKG
jgi:hypothetical protein